MPTSSSPQVDPVRPEVDGICHDDLSLVSEEVGRFLVARGLVWLTEFTVAGKGYGGSVFALTDFTAQIIADGRGLGEVVVARCLAAGELERKP
jgi:hypothetical protein